MQRAVVVVWCVVVLVLTSGMRSRAQDDREAVLAVVKQLFDGMRTADAEKIRSAFHPSAQLFSASTRNGQPQVSAQSIDGFVTAITRPHTDVYDERTKNEVVHIDGGLASVWADYAFYRGHVFNHCGVDAFHLARGADGWKIVSVADTRRTEPCEGWPR